MNTPETPPPVPSVGDVQTGARGGQLSGTYRGILGDLEVQVDVWSDGTGCLSTRPAIHGAWDRWSAPVSLKRQPVSEVTD